MIDLRHPQELGSRAAYSQAKALGQKTTRTSNADWYRDALDLDCQWHVVALSGSRVFSAVRYEAGGPWVEGPRLSFSTPPPEHLLDSAISEILESAPGRKPKSVGVVLHIGDEMAATELLAEIRSPAQLEELGQEVIASPATVLGDPSLTTDSTTTRLVPYAGADSAPHASAVSLSRSHEDFVRLLRKTGHDRNLPVRVCSVSAPLSFLSVLPAFLNFNGEHPQFVLLHYIKFSALAAFDPAGQLRQLRALPHRGRLHPSNLGDAINTAIDSLDLQKPRINIIPMSEVDPSPLLTQLHATLANPEEAEIRVLRPSLEEIGGGLADFRPEMLVAMPEYDSSEVSASFKQLYGEGWALQDFLPTSEAEAALFPSRNEMRLLRFGRALMPLLAFALIGLIAYALFAIISIISDPAWKHTPENTAAMQQRMGEASAKMLQIQHWESMLQGRSQGWTSMELLGRLAPEGSGLLVTAFSQNTRPDSTVSNNRVGFTREWSVSGLATAEALPLLVTLGSRDGMSELFREVAEATGNGSFNPGIDGRNLIVDMQRSQNASHDPEASFALRNPASYAYSFTLRISQSFGAEDPLAIRTQNLPLSPP